MKTKHTPELWKVDLETYVQLPDGDKQSVIEVVNEEDTQTIAFVGQDNHARLIAGAPELLGILKDVHSWLETNLALGHINAGTANRDGDLVSQIRAAIAKAEGK